MNYLKIAIIAPIIILYGTSYGVRMTALRDMLLTTKFIPKPMQKIPKEFLEIDENSDYKNYCSTKFARSQKLYKYAKDRQSRENKTKKPTSAWKPHSQKQKKQLLRYMMSHQ